MKNPSFHISYIFSNGFFEQITTLRVICVQLRQHNLWIYHRKLGAWRMRKYLFSRMHIIPTICLFVCLLGIYGHWEVRVLSVPDLLWYGTSVYNGHLWGPVTLTPVAERLALKLSPGFEHPILDLQSQWNVHIKHKLNHIMTNLILCFVSTVL